MTPLSLIDSRELVEPRVVHLDARLLLVGREQIDVDFNGALARGSGASGISALNPLPRAGRRSMHVNPSLTLKPDSGHPDVTPRAATSISLASAM